MFKDIFGKTIKPGMWVTYPTVGYSTDVKMKSAKVVRLIEVERYGKKYQYAIVEMTITLFGKGPEVPLTQEELAEQERRKASYRRMYKTTQYFTERKTKRSNVVLTGHRRVQLRNMIAGKLGEPYMPEVTTTTGCLPPI